MTAEEFWIKHYELGKNIPLTIMKEFAKFHVEAAFKASAEEAPIHCAESILTCYPLTNIQ